MKACQNAHVTTRITGHPRSPITRMGFRQFIGPAGRRHSALKKEMSFCRSIESFSGASAPLLRVRFRAFPQDKWGRERPPGGSTAARDAGPLSGPQDTPFKGGGSLPSSPIFLDRLGARPVIWG